MSMVSSPKIHRIEPPARVSATVWKCGAIEVRSPVRASPRTAVTGMPVASSPSLPGNDSRQRDGSLPMITHQKMHARDEEVQVGEVVDERVLEREVVEGREEVADHGHVDHGRRHQRVGEEADHRVVQDPEQALLVGPARGLEARVIGAAQRVEDRRQVHEQQVLDRRAC